MSDHTKPIPCPDCGQPIQVRGPSIKPGTTVHCPTCDHDVTLSGVHLRASGFPVST